jgi:hypothetical protein
MISILGMKYEKSMYYLWRPSLAIINKHVLYIYDNLPLAVVNKVF